MVTDPLPPGFRLSLARGVRRPLPTVLIGGSPTRVMRLSARGTAVLERWLDGSPVGSDRGERMMARRLVDSGVADPIPPPLDAQTAGLRCAIAIPVRDDPAGLEATLRSISETAPWAPVVVVDDGSKADAGAAALRVLRRLVSGGPAAARNTAWRNNVGADRPDIVVFVDAGVVATPGWIEGLLAHFADPAVGAVAPRVRARSGPRSSTSISMYERHRSPLDMGPDASFVRPASRVPYVPTAALALRMTVLEEFDGFDETLRFGEDVDLVWRLHEAGWRVRYEPAATVTHPDRETLPAWIRQRYSYGRSAAPLASRHRSAVAPLAVSGWSLGFWWLASLGRLRAASAVAAFTSVALAAKGTHRREKPARETPARQRALAAELARLALVANLRSAAPIASALRRAWTLPAAVLIALCWPRMRPRSRRFASLFATAIVVAPGVSDWWRHRQDGMGPLRWCSMRIADDFAYQAGVWAGSFDSRSAAALAPRFGTAKVTSSAARPV